MSSLTYPKPRRFLLFWISSHGLMMGLEEIGTGTTLTLEAVGMNELSFGWFKNLKVSRFYCNSILWSCNSSWRNLMVSFVCCRCRERSTRVSLLTCTMSSSLEMIKLWRMFNNWICCAIWTCALEIRLSCCRCHSLNCFTWFWYLNDRLVWMARSLDFFSYCVFWENLLEL